MADPAGFPWPTPEAFGSSLASVVGDAAAFELVPPIDAQVDAVSRVIEAATGMGLDDVVQNFALLVSGAEARAIADTTSKMATGVATQALVRAMQAAGAADAAADNAGAMAQVLGVVIGGIISAVFERDRALAATAQCAVRAIERIGPTCKARLQADKAVPTHPDGATPADLFREMAFWLAGKRLKPPLALSSVYLFLCGDALPSSVRSRGSFQPSTLAVAIPRDRRQLMWRCIQNITSSVVPADPPRPRLGDSGATSMAIMQEICREAWRAGQLRIVPGSNWMVGSTTDALYWANNWITGHHRLWLSCPDLAGGSASVPDAEATCMSHLDFAPTFIESLRDFENRLLEDFQEPPRSGNWTVPTGSKVASIKGRAAAILAAGGRRRQPGKGTRAVIGLGLAGALGYLATLL